MLENIIFSGNRTLKSSSPNISPSSLFPDRVQSSDSSLFGPLYTAEHDFNYFSMLSDSVIPTADVDLDNVVGGEDCGDVEQCLFDIEVSGNPEFGLATLATVGSIEEENAILGRSSWTKVCRIAHHRKCEILVYTLYFFRKYS